MCRFLIVILAAVLVSCFSSKRAYYFDNSPNSYSHENDSPLKAIKRSDLSASISLVISDAKKIAGDTSIHSNDTVPPKRNVSPPPRTKEEKRKAYLDAKKAYEEAAKEYAESRAATKDKNKNGFAIAGAVFVTLGVLAIGNPGTALVFGILGIGLSILGLKSRIWGLSVASLIIVGVVLSYLIAMSILYVE